MSPRTKEQNEEIRRMRIRQIMDAAARVYLRKGVMLEIRDVASAAQLGYGTVYHYYRNKHVLFGDMLDDALELARTQLAAVLRSVGTPMQRLRRLCRSLLVMWRKQPGTFVLYKTLWENTPLAHEEKMQAVQDKFQRQLYGPLVKLLVDALPSATFAQSEARANLLLSSLIGCAGLYVHRDRQDLDVDAVVDGLLGGLAPKEN